MGADQRILAANRALYQRLERTPADTIGQHVLSLHPSEALEEATRVMREMVDGLRASCPLPLRCADGTDLHVDTRIVAWTWCGESVLYGISRDLSARHRDVVALREARFDLEVRVAQRTQALQDANNALQHEISQRSAFEERLRALAVDLTRVEDVDRRRFATALHDSVGQSLALLRMQAAARGGEVAVHAWRGAGTRVIVRLPVTAPTHDPLPTAP